METLEPKPKRRPRVSLLSLLLIMALVATSLATAMLWHEVGPLRAEVRRLKHYAGELSIDDPAKIYAIPLGTNNELQWRWKVWIPNGRPYRIGSAGEGITDGRNDIVYGVEQRGPGYVGLQNSGEHLIEYTIKRDDRRDTWVGVLSVSDGSLTLPGGGFRQEWAGWGGCMNGGWTLSQKTTEADPGKRFELIRKRVARTEQGSVPELADGFAIWIEPAP